MPTLFTPFGKPIPAKEIYGPEYLALRPAVLERDKHRCCACNRGLKDGVRLEVHHRVYKPHTEILLEDLYTFCSQCHDALTDIQRRARYAYRRKKFVEYKNVRGQNERPVLPAREETPVEEIDSARESVTRPDLPQRKETRIPEVEIRKRVKPLL